MKLWILEHINKNGKFYGKAIEFIIQANTEQEARKLASEEDRDIDGINEFWLDTTITSCKELIVDDNVKESTVVMANYDCDAW